MQLQKEPGCRQISLGEIVRESLCKIPLMGTSQIYHIDGGLYYATRDPRNKEKIRVLYDRYKSLSG